MIRNAILPATLALLLPLAACGAEPEPRVVAGPEARKAVDEATLAYANCVVEGARQAPATDRTPGAVVQAVVDACQPVRQELAEKIITFHRIGRPSLTDEQLRIVADTSIEAVEPQIKSDAVAAYITRTSPDQAAQAAPNQKAE